MMQEFIDKLIRKLKKEIICLEDNFGDGIACIPADNAINIIRYEAKAHNNGWISCSERLPEEGEDVLVWFEYFRYGEYNGLYQTTGIGYVWKGDWSGFVNGSSGWHQLRIIAWQPLPPAYKEGGV